MRGDGTEQLPGRLYLTTRRLTLAGRAPLDVELDEIGELALVGDRLLVTLRDGTGLSIDAWRPRLLRVQIAAARAAGRT
jgi:predicted acyl esterase